MVLVLEHRPSWVESEQECDTPPEGRSSTINEVVAQECNTPPEGRSTG